MDGKQLSLRLRVSPSRGDVRLTHTMRYWKLQGGGALLDCDRFALLQKRDSTSGAAKWIVRCPKPG